MSTFFIYGRKSSEAEDRQILSIELQVTELRRFAAKKGIKILEILTEAKSAKAPWSSCIQFHDGASLPRGSYRSTLLEA